MNATLSELINDLENLALEYINSCKTPEELEQCRIFLMGKKGIIPEILSFLYRK